MKQKPLEKVELFLLKKGFVVKSLTRSSFDILARKEEVILLIKVLEDANSISREYSEEMISVASYINASPVIVADKAGGKLQDNVVYVRFGMWTISPETFFSCINSKMPFIRSNQAGLTALLDSAKLKGKREELGHSINSMSKVVGVSGRMIFNYENKDSEVTINTALKIRRVFGDNVFEEVNIFDTKAAMPGKCTTDIANKYVNLGFEAADTKKTPFNVIAKKGKEIILTEIGDKINPDVRSLSKLIDADNLVIFDKKKPKDLPSITKKEFFELEEANELIKFLKEF